MTVDVATAQDESPQYCPYFGNRGTEPLMRPGIGDRNLNCSWYHDNACCRANEVYDIFQTQRALPGADFGCQIAMSRLMCWVCDPDQALFYYNEQLHICQSMCDYVFAACQDALFQGRTLREQFGTSRALCEARRFKVVQDGGDEACFDGALSLTSAGGRFIARREKPVKVKNSAQTSAPLIAAVAAAVGLAVLATA
ncbi:hypothetical protein PTSG_02692 [Salpingoeca rosetta]|uniref:Folate receptor-like domain-containing protein n=1 Tax=Salpingoeca rosetta (strain ATCC 50818 / BSB-021) TaxID=946362 RepID=F2U311_SALR5|nr:uncharacterized protein PTSG_02692 [Salpingoeca rosetta]EGD82005.1 hypothetical protein PTSG_02692 [Salpingoeca rosetta]|eukprot:XP_004996188.1 hypothetical protein PTSG_02692 [Salpingoeca rosetta]